ncbi:gas vesicle protein GvpO, halophile-type [Salinilacihabitans rarus]|uniref:gas vesicle protein GvpO, halophile-type n=1 Tax=Salinilacihabitans rarus TaxID=2961596 RepID=UPI0020C850C5|nr:gas vesicle protein [Salinilacihabitans rarus]
MAEADAQSDSEPERCKALTAEGERCSRPARENGFCYQHDESDPTVSETETESEGEPDDQSTAAAESEVDPSGVETTDPGDVDTSDLDVEVDDERVEGLLAVRRTVERTAGQIIGRKFDGVSEITPTEDGWRAVVEVVERSSIPDTMDVLGRYEVDLTEDGVIEGYRRIDRYRRGDTVEYESG